MSPDLARQARGRAQRFFGLSDARLAVAECRPRAEQQELQDLVVGERARAFVEDAPAQPFAVAVVVWRFFGHGPPDVPTGTGASAGLRAVVGR